MIRQPEYHATKKGHFLFENALLFDVVKTLCLSNHFIRNMKRIAELDLTSNEFKDVKNTSKR